LLYFLCVSIRTLSLTTNVAREAKTFRPYPTFPALPPVQLDGWLSAVKIQVVSAIEWEWPHNWVVGPRVLNDSMFFWFERGSGTAWFGRPSNSYAFRAGDLLLIPQGVEHMIEGTAGDEPHVYAVHFFASLFGGIDLLKMLGFPEHVAHRQGSPCKAICERSVREYAVKPPGWATALSNDVYTLLLYMIRMETERFTPLMSVDHQSQLPRLLPVLDWIETHLSSHEITVADLSRQVFISETHFRRVFHKVFGMSPVQFIRQRRIERACTLLRTTDIPIKQLAQDCGFAEDAFFSRVFHRLVGTSPAAYRRAELL
jgi:AraC family transcriptional regulator of arabinose operon